MTNKVNSRNIRVFISSTFRDMEAERNELVNKTFPLLKKMARERQVTLSEIDLRWGITEKESQESKVVQICLEEIDRSHPFFIGVLGGRYGWCPKEEDVEWREIISPKYSETLQELYEGKSMTELEIRHGVLRSKENLHAAFYLRNMPSEEIEPEQQKLRDFVCSQKDFPVHRYKEIDELTNLVLEDFQHLLDQLYPEESSNTWESLSLRQDYFLHRLTRYYISSEEAENEILHFVDQDKEKGLVVTGESGIGKSTLMAKIGLELRERDDVDVLSFFPANSSNGSTISEMADWFCQGFSFLYGFDYEKDASHVAEFKRAALKIEPDKKLILIVDGINQIVTTDDTGNDMTWWPSWHNNVYVVFSTPSNSLIVNNLKRFHFKSIEVNALSLDQRVELSNRYLKGAFNKTLSPEQLGIIGKTNPLLENTLVFITFLDEIRRFGSFERLTEEMSTLSSITTMDSFFSQVIIRQKNQFHTKTLAEKYERVLSSIALSYKGLSEDSLIAIAHISRLDLSIIIGMNELNLTEKDGKIVFAHDVFRKSVMQNFLDSEEKVLSIRKGIIDYMNEQEDEADKLFETAFQYFKMGCLDELYLLISNMRAYVIFSSYGKLNELGLYWTKLLKENPYRYDILNIIYNEMAEENNAFMSGMMFYITVATQSNNILTLSRFMINNMRLPQAAKRLNYALLKMLENEHEDGYEEIKNTTKQNLAATERLEGDFYHALKQYAIGISENTDMSDATISNIGELFLSLFERSENKTYVEYAQQILKSVLDARIKKYGTEEHEAVALAYANYASAISIENSEYGLKLHKKSLDIFEKINGHYNIDVALQYGNMARVVWIANPEKGVQYSEKALDIYSTLLGDDADDTLKEHWQLALAYKQINDFESSWKHGQRACSFGYYKHGEEFDVTVYLKSLLSGFFGKDDYEHAEEVGLYALSLIGDDSSFSASFHDDLGKVYHAMGKEEISDLHYEKAIEINIQKKQYDEAQNSLCYYSQKCFGNGEIEKTQRLLERIIDINEEFCLDESLILSYAYYNIGVLLYGYQNDTENAIRMIKRAIETREKLVDDDEADLVEYKSTLKKVLSGSFASVDATGENSRHAIELMADILGETNSQALNVFAEGLRAFDKGNMDQAAHMLKIAKSYLDEKAPASAHAQIVRYLAYCDEMPYSHTNGNKGTPTKIFAQYEAARKLAEIDRNYSLAAEICHDAAMFCSRLGDYSTSEVCYWRKFENILSQGLLFSLDAAITLYNILMVAGQKGGLQPDDAMAMVSLSLCIYNNIDDVQEDLKERLDEHYQTIADTMDENDIIPTEEWGFLLWGLRNYIQKRDDFNSNKLQSELLENAKNYFKDIENWETLSTIYLYYINSLLSLGDYAKAMYEMRLFSKDYMQYLDRGYQKSAEEMIYLLAIALHDFDMAERIRENNSITEETTHKYMELFMPCYSALLNKEEEKARVLFSELQSKLECESLAESQYFDMATYCAYTQRPYEGRKYMELWMGCVNDVPSEYQQYYEPAIAMIKKLLE